jgi:hypothetical protein
VLWRGRAKLQTCGILVAWEQSSAGISPVFEVPAEAVSWMSSIAASKGSGWKSVDEREGESIGRYIFRSDLGKIEGRRHTTDRVRRVWLTFPRTHAFNRLMWMFDIPPIKPLQADVKGGGSASARLFSTACIAVMT